MFPGFFFNLLMFPPSAGGATCPPYDLKSQKGQIEGIIRFYAASATCQGDKLKWTPTCQGTNCGARMFPGFLLNLSLFLSSALGQLLVGPLRPLRGHSRLPARVMQPSGLRPSPTDAAAETKRWTVPAGHQRPSKLFVKRLLRPSGTLPNSRPSRQTRRAKTLRFPSFFLFRQAETFAK